MSTATKQKMDVIHDMTTYTKKPMNAYVNLAKSYEQCDRIYIDVVGKHDPHPAVTPFRADRIFPRGEPHHLILAVYNPTDGSKIPRRFYDKRGRMFGGMPVNNPVSRTGVRTGACDQPGCTGTYVTDTHGEHVCDLCGVIADTTEMDVDNGMVDESVEYLVDTETADDDFDVGTPADAYVGMVGGGALPRKFDDAIERIFEFEKSVGITHKHKHPAKRVTMPKHVVGTRMMAEEHLLSVVLALIRDGVNTLTKIVNAMPYLNDNNGAVLRAIAILSGEKPRARTGKIGTPRIVATRKNARVVTYAVL